MGKGIPIVTYACFNIIAYAQTIEKAFPGIWKYKISEWIKIQEITH
jgi:hypothetical protein